MYPRRFPMFIITALIVIGLLMLGGSMIQRSAWTQGYMMGQLAAKGADGAIAPYMAYGPGFGGGPFASGLGCLIPLGLLALAFFAVGGFFRHRAWHGAEGHQGGPTESWNWHWHERHQGPPPWQQGWNDPGRPATGTPPGATRPEDTPAATKPGGATTPGAISDQGDDTATV